MTKFKNEYTIELTEDYCTGDKPHRLAIDCDVNFNNTLEQFINIISIDNKITVDTHWTSSYNKYFDYTYEPFMTDGFYLRKFIFCKDITHLKYLSYEIQTLLDNLIELEKNFKADCYTDKKHTTIKGSTNG